jgi:predicted DNA-binding transcriptional regulator AlpA
MLEQAIETLTVELRRLREVIERQNALVNVEQAKPACAQRPHHSPPIVLRASEKLTDRFLKEQAVAELTGLSLATVRRWRLFRTGPPYRKLGSAVRYSREDVMDWLNAQRIT